MVKLLGTLSRFQPIHAIVIGDFVLDTYTSGTVNRISPEAPVPVLKVTKRESLPGMAGNVMLNLISLGAKVTAMGRVGPDRAGSDLCKVLEDEGGITSSLIIQEDYATPIKNRLIAGAQQIVRVDSETIDPLPEALEDEMVKVFQKKIKKAQIVAISDYAKGLLTPTLLGQIINISRENNVPVIIDPKGLDFNKYRYATLIKPNLKEAYLAANVSKNEPLEKVAEILLKQTQAEMLLITKSQEGISLFHQNGEQMDFPVKSKEVIDVTGAGDTVLAMITMALANKLDLHHTMELANFTAGLSIERLGCARITLADLTERLLESSVSNKIFEESHLFALEQTLKGNDFIVFGLEQSQEMTTSLFHALRTLSEKVKDGKLILYLSSDTPNPEFISLLSSLNEVDFIVLKSESLFHLCENIHPKSVYALQDEQLVALDHAKLLL